MGHGVDGCVDGCVAKDHHLQGRVIHHPHSQPVLCLVAAFRLPEHLQPHRDHRQVLAARFRSTRGALKCSPLAIETIMSGSRGKRGERRRTGTCRGGGRGHLQGGFIVHVIGRLIEDHSQRPARRLDLAGHLRDLKKGGASPGHSE